MTTLSADKPRDYQLGDREEYPVIAADIIYEGAAVGENGSGYARPLQAGDPFGQNAGLGFAMPISAIRDVLPRLARGQDIEPAFMGVNLVDAPDQAGILVRGIVDDSPAESAGLREGDVITHLDQLSIRDRSALTDFLWRNKAAGDSMTVTVQRSGETVVLELQLTARPS